MYGKWGPFCLGLNVLNGLNWGWHCVDSQRSYTTTPDHYDDVINWKHFPRYWPFVRGIRRFPVNSPHKGQWCGALMFSLICVWINSSANNREAGYLRRYRTHYDVIIMMLTYHWWKWLHISLHLIWDLFHKRFMSTRGFMSSLWFWFQ